MTSSSKDMDAVLEAMLADVDRLSDAELRAELKEDGRDFAEVAAQVGSIFESAVAAFQQSRRGELKKRDGIAGGPATSMPGLPQTSHGKRALLRRAIARAEGSGSQMTLGFRQLEEMTDSDLAALLEQLLELGALRKADFEEDGD